MVCCFCRSGDMGQGGIVRRQRQRRRVARRGTVSASGRPYCTTCPSSLLSFCCGVSFRSKRSTTRSSRSISGYRAVFWLGRTLTRRQPRLRLARHLFLQHVDERDFPMPASPLNTPPARGRPWAGPSAPGAARLPARAPRGGSGPCSPPLPGGSGRTLIQDPIDLKWLGEPFSSDGLRIDRQEAPRAAARSPH